ncbi:MAG: Gx transporter family protein [Lachnotalea sp.]
MKTKNIVYCGVLIAVAMLAGYIEQSLPINIGIPGVKIGFANAVTIVALSVLGKKEAILITLLRIILSAFMFGKLFAMIFSIVGAVLSLVSMLGLKKTGKFSNVGISVSGGVSHNVGQIIAAAILLHTKAIIYYLPVLIIAGVVSGIVIGMISQIIIARVNTFQIRSTE